jgi:DNA-binding NarL/FixJ family response regulator
MGHPKKRILLADDQQEILNAVERILKDEFDVVGAVNSGERAIDAATRLAPDILLLDISMPVMNGLEVALHLKDSGSKAKVIFLTVNEDRAIVELALSLGALGYVLKKRLVSDLVPAIREAMENRVFVSSTMILQGNRWQQPVVT